MSNTPIHLDEIASPISRSHHNPHKIRNGSSPSRHILSTRSSTSPPSLQPLHQPCSSKKVARHRLKKRHRQVAQVFSASHSSSSASSSSENNSSYKKSRTSTFLIEVPVSYFVLILPYFTAAYHIKAGEQFALHFTAPSACVCAHIHACACAYLRERRNIRYFIIIIIILSYLFEGVREGMKVLLLLCVSVWCMYASPSAPRLM